MLSNMVQNELWALEAKILALNALPKKEHSKELQSLAVSLQKKYRRKVKVLNDIRAIEEVGR